MEAKQQEEQLIQLRENAAAELSSLRKFVKRIDDAAEKQEDSVKGIPMEIDVNKLEQEVAAPLMAHQKKGTGEE